MQGGRWPGGCEELGVSARELEEVVRELNCVLDNMSG